MDNIARGFGQLVASVSLLFTSFLGHTSPAANATLNPQPTVTVQQTADGPTYTIAKSLSYQGYSVTMSAAVPKNGGNITGSISGNCTGTITGHYDGKDNGAISGQSHINCQVAFLQVPGDVTFTGTVNKTAKNAQLLLVFNVGSINKSQNVVVNFK